MKIIFDPRNQILKHCILLSQTRINNMKSIRHILLSFVNLEIFNSRSSIYLLILMFIILLLATETLIKNAILPI